MMFISSGLPIPVDTKIYMDSVKDRNEAEMPKLTISWSIRTLIDLRKELSIFLKE